MFNKFKQLNKLRKFAKREEKVEKEGVEVTVNGKMQIEEVKLNPDLDQKKQQRLLKECANEAMKKIQRKIATEMFSG